MSASIVRTIQTALRHLGGVSACPETLGEAEIAECEIEVRPWPKVLPHPGDVVIYQRKQGGDSAQPRAAGAKKGWDKLRERKREALHAIAEYQREIRRNPMLASLLENEIADEQRIHDLIDAYLPDEETGRPREFRVGRERRNALTELRAS